VRLEYQYQTKLGSYCRADLWLDLGSGQEALIMLKTVNTSFRFDGVDVNTRPITSNIRGVIKDIGKLRDAANECSGWMVFPIYPVSALESDREKQLRRHSTRSGPCAAAERSLKASSSVRLLGASPGT
jgi:hypothetical protein